MTSENSSRSAEADADILVIGAGFAGLSTAYHLKRSGARRVIVLERARRLGAHASGNNAGMIRQAIADPVLARLAVEGRRLLQKAQANGFGRFGYQANGSMMVARGPNDEWTAIERTMRSLRLPFRSLTAKQAAGRVAVLADADFDRALICPSDAFVDIDRLLAAFVAALRRLRVPVLYGRRIRSIHRQNGDFIVTAGRQRWRARCIVNASGAWASEIGRLAGAARVPLKAYRRHLFFSDRAPARAASWPFVWDLSHGCYFRPIDGSLLLSPCDKQTGAPDRPAARRLLAKKLRSHLPSLATAPIARARAGLRTMVPDGRFVIGEDDKLKGFYWVAGLGGHGVTTSFSTGRLAARLILGLSVPPAVRKAFSPGRF